MKGFGDLSFKSCYGNRRRVITQSVLDNQIVLAFAEYEADSGIISWLTHFVIDGCKIEVDLACKVRFKLNSF